MSCSLLPEMSPDSEDEWNPSASETQPPAGVKLDGSSVKEACTFFLANFQETKSIMHNVQKQLDISVGRMDALEELFLQQVFPAFRAESNRFRKTAKNWRKLHEGEMQAFEKTRQILLKENTELRSEKEAERKGLVEEIEILRHDAEEERCRLLRYNDKLRTEVEALKSGHEVAIQELRQGAEAERQRLIDALEKERKHRQAIKSGMRDLKQANIVLQPPPPRASATVPNGLRWDEEADKTGWVNIKSSGQESGRGVQTNSSRKLQTSESYLPIGAHMRQLQIENLFLQDGGKRKKHRQQQCTAAAIPKEAEVQSTPSVSRHSFEGPQLLPSMAVRQEEEILPGLVEVVKNVIEDPKLEPPAIECGLPVIENAGVPLEHEISAGAAKEGDTGNIQGWPEASDRFKDGTPTLSPEDPFQLVELVTCAHLHSPTAESKTCSTAMDSHMKEVHMAKCSSMHHQPMEDPNRTSACAGNEQRCLNEEEDLIKPQEEALDADLREGELEAQGGERWWRNMRSAVEAASAEYSHDDFLSTPRALALANLAAHGKNQQDVIEKPCKGEQTRLRQNRKRTRNPFEGVSEEPPQQAPTGFRLPLSPSTGMDYDPAQATQFPVVHEVPAGTASDMPDHHALGKKLPEREKKSPLIVRLGEERSDTRRDQTEDILGTSGGLMVHRSEGWAMDEHARSCWMAAARGGSPVPNVIRGVSGKSDPFPAVPAFKYKEVVRRKEDREALQAGDCHQCRKFYEAVQQGNENGMVASTCEHHQAASRHRWQHKPPATPDGFWNIGFDTDPTQG